MGQPPYLYARHPGVFDLHAQDIALLFGPPASLALAGTQAVVLAELKQAQLRRALELVQLAETLVARHTELDQPVST